VLTFFTSIVGVMANSAAEDEQLPTRQQDAMADHGCNSIAFLLLRRKARKISFQSGVASNY